MGRIISWMLTKDATNRPLMRDLIKDPFIIESIRDYKERLGDILKEGPRSGGELDKLREEMAKAQGKRQTYKAQLAQIVTHDADSPELDLNPEQKKKLKAMERQLRTQLADVQVQIYIMEKQLADTESTDAMQIVSHFEQTLNESDLDGPPPGDDDGPGGGGGGGGGAAK